MLRIFTNKLKQSMNNIIDSVLKKAFKSWKLENGIIWNPFLFNIYLNDLLDFEIEGDKIDFADNTANFVHR